MWSYYQMKRMRKSNIVGFIAAFGVAASSVQAKPSCTPEEFDKFFQSNMNLAKKNGWRVAKQFSDVAQGLRYHRIYAIRSNGDKMIVDLFKATCHATVPWLPFQKEDPPKHFLEPVTPN